MSIQILPRTDRWQGALQLVDGAEIELIGGRLIVYTGVSYWHKAKPKTDIATVFNGVFK